jgi:hypothetical protein
MKTADQIEKFLSKFDDSANKYPGMTCEEGVFEALSWVAGEISDEDFYEGLGV